MGTQLPVWMKKMLKELDTPAMRKLYRDQKLSNKGFDKSVEEISKEVEDLLKHLRTPYNGDSNEK